MENKEQITNPLIKLWNESVDKIDEGIAGINLVHGSISGLTIYAFDSKSFENKTEKQIKKEIEDRFWQDGHIVFNSSKVVVKDDYVFIIGFASKITYENKGKE